MMIRKVPVNVPVFCGNEKKYLMDCIDTGWISSSGQYIEKFETEMAKYVGMKHAVSVCNGTAALEAAVLALDLEKGSEVIMPDFTIISCAQAIVKAGLMPVAVDCNSDDWNMNVSLIEEKITPKTKAIMMVHIYGLPSDVDAILAIAKKYNLKVIEDAAEAHGLTYKGKQCGSFGDVSIFSFFPNKHITSGEGGMILTNDDVYNERLRKIRNLYFDAERRYIHEEIGSNFRMTNMQAAIGLAQLEHIEWTLKRKRTIAAYYYKELDCLKEFIQLPLQKLPYADNINWVFGIVVKNSKYTADDIMAKLKEVGVDTRHFFYPMHMQPCLLKIDGFKEKNQIENSVSSNIAKYGFYIPSGVGLSLEDQEYVVKCLKNIFLA